MALGAVGIWHNTQKAGVLDIAKKVVDAFQKGGIKTYMGNPLAAALGYGKENVSPDYRECDFLCVLGGDGTLLSALDIALPLDLPMLGINMGRVGFLSEVQIQDLEEDLGLLLQGQYTIDERMLLEVYIPGQSNAFALNEVSFNRSSSTVGILSLQVEASGVLIDRYSGDGVIVASPTGSTAYSLSAGGPIVAPELDLMVITPICPHTLTARPVVMPADTPVSVRVHNGIKNAQMLLDGRKAYDISNELGDIIIRKAEKRARFIRIRERNYFDLLRHKLSDWMH